MTRQTPYIPVKVGTQFFGRARIFACPLTPIPTARASQKHWVPAFAGMSGEYA